MAVAALSWTRGAIVGSLFDWWIVAVVVEVGLVSIINYPTMKYTLKHAFDMYIQLGSTAMHMEFVQFRFGVEPAAAI